MIQDNFQNIRQKTGQARLLAVTKTRSVEAIKEALATGHRLFGENRVQEAATKYPALRQEYPDIELHLIGPLQTNKVAQAVALFDVIQTLDRPKLAEILVKEMKKQNKKLKFFIEVNIGRETQKAGIWPEDAAAFYAQGKELGLEINGLMAIPPADQDPVPFFRQMKKLADQLALPELSIGMSGDYEQAIRCGATMVRIGTALFKP